MSHQGNVRIQKELAEVMGEDQKLLGAELVADNLRHWKGRIAGPEGSPYEGGVFWVDIVLPPEYPFVPPKMKFDTKVWHPNVSSVTGAICLDILKDQWSPALTIRTALLSLQALLSCPVPDDPQDAQVAAQYKADRAAWEATARSWTQQHARPQDSKLQNIVGMGFPAEKAREALARCGNDEQRAIEMLLSGM